VSKIAFRVEVKEETLRKAIKILGDADRLKIMVRKDPMDLAAAALYLAYTMNARARRGAPGEGAP
jgi:transcription initiation factor TFIIIB Brf1 subunit/transcription initiation factor TFIIB